MTTIIEADLVFGCWHVHKNRGFSRPMESFRGSYYRCLLAQGRVCYAGIRPMERDIQALEGLPTSDPTMEDLGISHMSDLRTSRLCEV